MRLVECIIHFTLCFFIASLPLVLIADGIIIRVKQIHKIDTEKGRPPNEWADGKWS